MVLRWTAAGVLEAERKFRRITGYTAMPKLAAALRAHDASLNRSTNKLTCMVRHLINEQAASQFQQRNGHLPCS